MKWTWEEIIKWLAGSGMVTAIVAFIAKQMDWIRFRTKDEASVEKVRSETASDLATVNNKKIDDEVKISKAALEWTVQLAEQLQKANMNSDKRQLEIDRLHELITKMKNDFETQIDKVEKLLDETKRELHIQKNKNQDLLEQLNKYLNAGKR